MKGGLLFLSILPPSRPITSTIACIGHCSRITPKHRPGLPLVAWKRTRRAYCGISEARSSPDSYIETLWRKNISNSFLAFATLLCHATYFSYQSFCYTGYYSSKMYYLYQTFKQITRVYLSRELTMCLSVGCCLVSTSTR